MARVAGVVDVVACVDVALHCEVEGVGVAGDTTLIVPHFQAFVGGAMIGVPLGCWFDNREVGGIDPTFV